MMVGFSILVFLFFFFNSRAEQIELFHSFHGVFHTLSYFFILNEFFFFPFPGTSGAYAEAGRGGLGMCSHVREKWPAYTSPGLVSYL